MKLNEEKGLCGCVILNYNDSNTTINLVNKIKEYSSIDYIIIVDNFSLDDSYANLLELESAKIKLVKTEKNGGYGYGNNIGVQYAYERLKCKYVLIANPDVIFENVLVENMLKCMKQDLKIAVVAPTQLDINGNYIRDRAWKIPTITQYIFSAEMIIGKYTRHFHYPDEMFWQMGDKEVDCVPGSLLLVRARVFMEVNGFDQEMFLFCEETTLAKKLKDKKYRTILIDDTYIHQHSISINRSIRKVSKQRQLLLNSRYVFMKKYLYANKWQLLLAKGWYALALLESVVIETIKGKKLV